MFDNVYEETFEANYATFSLKSFCYKKQFYVALVHIYVCLLYAIENRSDTFDFVARVFTSRHKLLEINKRKPQTVNFSS